MQQVQDLFYALQEWYSLIQQTEKAKALITALKRDSLEGNILRFLESNTDERVARHFILESKVRASRQSVLLPYLESRILEMSSRRQSLEQEMSRDYPLRLELPEGYSCQYMVELPDEFSSMYNKIVKSPLHDPTNRTVYNEQGGWADVQITDSSYVTLRESSEAKSRSTEVVCMRPFVLVGVVEAYLEDVGTPRSEALLTPAEQLVSHDLLT